MPRIRGTAFATALALGLHLAPGAHAGLIFDYNATVNVATAPTLPPNSPGSIAAVIALGAGNSLTFTTNAATGIDVSLPGGADINFGNILFNPSGSSTVVSYDVYFNYQVTIIDQPSGMSGTVNFTGDVAGFARGTPRAINSSIGSFAVSPASLVLGGYTYSINARTATGPGSSFDGVLQGNIEATPIAAVPEPSTLVMAGSGGLLGLGCWLRRRRRGRVSGGAT